MTIVVNTSLLSVVELLLPMQVLNGLKRGGKRMRSMRVCEDSRGFAGLLHCLVSG